MKKTPWLLILSFVLAGVFVVHSIYQILTFGWRQGTYFWFCNLALGLGSIAIYFKRRHCVELLLSILIPTQLFWVLDYTKRALTGADLFGLTEALYHPGVTSFGFFIGHYHLLLIPILLYALYSLPPIPSQRWKNLLLLAFPIFIISFYLFPAEQNINCIHATCLETLSVIDGKKYSIVFAVFITLVVFLMGFGVSRLAKIEVSDKARKSLLLGCLGFALLITGLGFSRKLRIPTFSCLDPFEDGTVRVECRYLNEHVKDWMNLRYDIVNKTTASQDCTSFIEFEGKKEVFQEGLTAYPGVPLEIAILIHYPDKNTRIKLSAACKPSGH